jgi:hypothetical protein
LVVELVQKLKFLSKLLRDSLIPVPGFLGVDLGYPFIHRQLARALAFLFTCNGMITGI